MIQLKLDAAALAALFPDGSQARVELQSAVLAEFCRKNIKGSVLHADLTKMIDQAKSEALSIALKDLGVSTSWRGSRVALSDSFKSTLLEQARSAFRETVSVMLSEEFRAATERAAAEIKPTVNARVAKITDTEITTQIRAKLSAVVSGVLAA